MLEKSPPAFMSGRGKGNILKYARTFYSYRDLASGETSYPEPNPWGFVKSQIDMEEGKYPTPVGSIPPHGGRDISTSNAM